MAQVSRAMTRSSSGSILVRAPGKLFLLGEYAVLFGGPAIVRAVDRYVIVTIEPLDSVGPTSIEVSSRGASMPPLKAVWNGQLDYASPCPEHELVMTILDALVAHGVVHQHFGAVKCTIDSRELFHHGQKLGLGSSAAVTHALVKAIVEYASLGTGSVLLPSDFVFNVHRAFQHGRGSGADIGAGVMGGTYSFRRASEHTLPDMARITLPTKLHMTSIWAGQPASTTQALGSLDDFHTRHPGQFSAALTPILALAENGTSALQAGDAAYFVSLCDEYGHNLSEFGRTVGVDIMSSSHQELRQIARSCGVVYKPSGAGNGDFGVGYSLDIKALERFERKAEQAGYTRIELGSGEPCQRI